MLLSESYKKRLKELAGISVINEVTDAERTSAFALSNQRIPYNKDLMIQAIKEGREMGVLFQSNNDKYKMPTSKYRIIYPVAMGLSKKGNPVIRAYHKMGQSESEAIKTGRRSAEAEGVWRLLKATNIKSMWFTGNFFKASPDGYNARDKGMTQIEIAADFAKINKFQNDLINSIKNKEERDNQRKNIVKLFKEPEKDDVNKPKTNNDQGDLDQNSPLPTETEPEKEV